MLYFINRYMSQMAFSLFGLYLFSVVYAISIDTGTNVIENLNSLGKFLASGGFIVSFLTLLNVILGKQFDKENAQVEYGNYILFMLNQQRAFIKIYQGDINKQYDVLTDNEIMIKSLMVRLAKFDERLVMPVNVEKTLFLLSTDNPEIVSYIDKSQRDFMYLAEKIASHNDLYIDEFAKKIPDNLKYGMCLSDAQVSTLIGDKIVYELESSLKYIESQLNTLDNQLLATHINLIDAMKGKYPKRKFIHPITGGCSA
ncbi:hypothetical protein J2R62_16980 [Plesiomonas shigelloides]|uniref:Uncharacterized protein n=1 Tax=Plesiomonas shigelloides TaxID=703 RepID=A0A8I1WCK7_PLESH|nr:hypothetical protein [Plesiomonas shigelloides]MBO1109864.1 hypothetical protein [Plesiomonas shigelloides]